jgi:hypothetical protein
MVLVQFGIEARWTTWAPLYPAQATSFTPALASFPVRDDQEPPHLEPGGLVPGRRARRPRLVRRPVQARGVVIRPDGPLSGKHRLGFAEARGSPSIVHPEFERTLSPFARAACGSEEVTRAHRPMRRWAGQYRRPAGARRSPTASVRPPTPPVSREGIGPPWRGE